MADDILPDGGLPPGVTPISPKAVPARRRAKSRIAQSSKTGNVIAMPSRALPDVRRLLVEGQSTPQVQLPPELEKVVQQRALELAQEAHELCLEHLRRRIAFHAECGWPQRVLDVRAAERALAEGGLPHALVRRWHLELEGIERQARMLAKSSQEFLANVQATRGDDDTRE